MSRVHLTRPQRVRRNEPGAIVGELAHVSFDAPVIAQVDRTDISKLVKQVTAAARYLHIDPARLRRFVCEIDRSLLADIERIDAALPEYAQAVLDRRVPVPRTRDNVSYINKARRRPIR